MFHFRWFLFSRYTFLNRIFFESLFRVRTIGIRIFIIRDLIVVFICFYNFCPNKSRNERVFTKHAYSFPDVKRSIKTILYTIITVYQYLFFCAFFYFRFLEMRRHDVRIWNIILASYQMRTDNQNIVLSNYLFSIHINKVYYKQKLWFSNEITISSKCETKTTNKLYLLQ